MLSAVTDNSTIQQLLGLRNSDNNSAMGWPLHTSLTHNLQRSVAPLSPFPTPRPAQCAFFQTTACLILFTQITVKAVAVQ